MGLSQKWLCTLLLIISVVFHMSVITRGDERLETEGWGRDPCRFRRRGCGRFGGGRGSGFGGGGRK
ncbi:hypothetical protein HanIR_Chr04g0205431 [Helianthus annuus]|nr:hypothetical protein HanIR_Chr04g0205431 [Helianthus annuus]